MPSAPDVFVVELRRTGQSVTVGPEKSILEAVQDLVEVDYFCLQGVCGTCVQVVLDGTPLHRDNVLSDQARAAGNRITICVSRSSTDLLVLDL